MVNIITTKTKSESQAIGMSYSWWRTALIGVGLGIIYYVLTIIIKSYVTDPIFCHSASSHAPSCLDSMGMSGDIATILVATMGIAMMLRFVMARPLIIAVASGAVLWGLARWIDGLFWVEAIAWSMLLYGFAYVLFSWIARYIRIVPVLIAMTAIIVLIRVSTSL